MGFAQIYNRKGNDIMEKGFVSTMRKGFHMTFENGLTASVQWGAGNYCDNHFPEDMDFSCTKDARSDTAEVAVIYKGKFINANHFMSEENADWMDDVVGWLTPSQVVDFLRKVRDANISELEGI